MSARVIILGAGRPLDGQTPSGLRQTGRGQKVLDWILHAFKQLDAEIVYVGGYRAAEIAEQYRNLQFVFNEDWETTGALASLFKAPLSADRDHYVCYSDTVFRGDLVSWLCGIAPDRVAIAIDRAFLLRRGDDAHRGGSSKEQVTVDSNNRITGVSNGGGANETVAEFVGLMRLPRGVMPKVLQIAPIATGARRRHHLSALVEELCRADVNVEAVNAEGNWSDLDSDMALSRFVLGTKAETLDRLRERVRNANIEAQVRFSVGRWRATAAAVLEDIRRTFPAGPLAVRSSAEIEDGFASAHAGRFRTCLNVGRDIASLTDAIESVIASYEGLHGDQVFVQPMIPNVAWSGVLFTRGMGTGAPYYSVNFTAGPNTLGITSGLAQNDRTLVIHRTNGRFPSGCPQGVAKLIEAAREIEDLVDYDRLDIEFAIDQENKVHILQVRPLAASHEWSNDAALLRVVSVAAGQFEKLSGPSSGIAGDSNVWANMPDWNPAEIVGSRPKGLAASLYAYLVTDDVWAQQRAEFGYRDLRGTPLMRMFASQPYIDVRASFNSFTPASMPDETAGRLVDAYLRKLRGRPELHDKIEFDIVPTCLAFDFSKWDNDLRNEAGLSRDEMTALREGLRQVTNGAFRRYRDDFAAGAELSRRFAVTKSRPSSLARAKELLADCRKFGTLPFAHLAREAFIAVTLLRSAVAKEAISPERLERFLASIHTVSQTLSDDAASVRKGELTFDAFSDRYGHLRPGTYDILSPCYADSPNYYLRPLIEQAEVTTTVPFEWQPREVAALEQLLEEAGLVISISELDRFLRVAIEGRESQKFLFTRNLSLALNDIAAFGAEHGLSREQLSELHYADLTDEVSDAVGLADKLRARSEEMCAKRMLEQAVELPPILRSQRDFWGFYYPPTEPNYVTTGRVTASGIELQQHVGDELDLAGKIVLIPGADPGYDWLFGHGIGGLITQFGGANSHMAIRAAEHRLPSAIGVGHDRYKGLKRARLIDLNCATRQLAVLS